MSRISTYRIEIKKKAQRCSTQMEHNEERHGKTNCAIYLGILRTQFGVEVESIIVIKN
jgi:hypothetical protein